MAQLTGSSQAISLGESGYAIKAPGIRGDAALARPRSAADRARSRTATDGTDALDSALAAAHVTEIRQVELRLTPQSPSGAAAALRGASGQAQVELQVPDLGPDTGQLVLACDENGVLTWHLPVKDQLGVQSPTSRGAGGIKRFRIPVIPSSQGPAAPADGTQRSLLGVVGRKLLKVLVYPVLDPVVGAVGEFFAERWETHARPYGLRTFTPDNRRTSGAGALQAVDWDRLCAGRALLFVHGTFSTAHGAFSAFPDAVFDELYRRYDGRVLAFNHFTLSHDPRRNVEWLLEQVPTGHALEVDIVCHSRGGLVARTLAERPAGFGLVQARIGVRRVVFVAAPNQGTPLADPDHIVDMLDRFTTVLNMFPCGALAETLESIITVVKVIAHGALTGLDGLASMRPLGEFIRTLNQGASSGTGYYAVSADFEPTNEGLRALLAGTVADAVLDRVFEAVHNDLVVPEPGVYDANGNAAFPIPAERLLRIPSGAGVVHTTVFGHAPAIAKVAEWLA